MAKNHKYHRSRLEFETTLPVDRVLDLGRQTVQAQRTLKLDDEYDGAFSVLVKSIVGFKILHFTLSARSSGERTVGSTEIQEYRTSQTTVSFIPVGPKTMEGYGEYRRFMNSLSQVIQAADPGAQCRIIEREESAA